MLFGTIIILITIVDLFICDACQTSVGNEKFELRTRTFQKLVAERTKQCRHINRDFPKLEGIWFYVLRKISLKPSSSVRCGVLNVSDASANGFKSTLEYIEEGKSKNIAMNGYFINKETAEIPGMKDLVTGNPPLNYRFTVQMGICNNDSIFFILPKHYSGGGVIFSRNVSVESNQLMHQLETYDEMNGNERTVRVSRNCNLGYHRNHLE